MSRRDSAIAALLFSAHLTWLMTTADTLGFMRDEGFYFAASRAYGEWFELLATDPAQALSRATIDRYFGINREHPPFVKSLFALSHTLLQQKLSLFDEPSLSFRFPAMLLSSCAVALTHIWGAQRFGSVAGLVGALSFALMPRVFFHSHLACFDMPVCAMWLFTTYVYARSLESQGWGWPIATAVAFGLLLATKHNAWLFPFAAAGHFALTRAPQAWRERRLELPRAWLCSFVLSPLLFYVAWPWLWHDTGLRLREYALFHLRHDYYNMEFLGQTYWAPPFPRAYAWLMTLGTVPLVTLAIAGLGLAVALYRATRHVGRKRLQSAAPHVTAARAPERAADSDLALWGVCLLVGYAPWLSTGTPIFGGTKHWLTAYPFLCLFAALGFKTALAALAQLSPFRNACAARALPLALASSLLVAPLQMTLDSHPFGLSFYTPLVGGVPGAASLGLNRTFWGYTTHDLAALINQRAPARGTIYVHDTALQSFAMLQRDRRLRDDLRGSLSIPASDIALYHHEPHMSRVEHQIWLEYGSVSPDGVVVFAGVPLAWAFVRPR
jgi:4-amino-4-deoxy-L-arabinose transferase-like glycosyltransferase